MVGIAVLYSTTEAKVVRNYVVALWLADISHVAITSYILGAELVLDIVNWNPMTWGNIGATVSTHSTYIPSLDTTINKMKRSSCSQPGLPIYLDSLGQIANRQLYLLVIRKDSEISIIHRYVEGH